MISMYVKKIANKEKLNQQEAYLLMKDLISQPVNEAETAALLSALSLRGETPEELAGFAAAIKENRHDVSHSVIGVIDTCGTGGDLKGTFNISTASAFVIAALGQPVAKHGNGAVTSKSGSMDVLSELGVEPAVTAEQALAELESRNVTFLHAPSFHPALKKFASVRKKLPFRTVFNLIGPLSNPADPDYQLIGASSEKNAETLADALKLRGAKRAVVVFGTDGMDEVSITAPTKLYLVNEGKITENVVTPETAGLKTADAFTSIQVQSSRESAALILQVLQGKAPQAAQDIVALNAGTALFCANKAATIGDGAALAEQVIRSGHAYEFFRQLSAEGGPVHAAN